MKKITFVFLLVLVCLFSAFSQTAKKPNPYKFGIGAGFYPGLTEPFALDVKFYTKTGNSFEFIGYNLEKAYRLTALFNPYFPINRQGNLRIVVGPGLHMGFWKEEFKTSNSYTNPIIGMDGIAGMEYRIPKLPLSFQLHYQPSADLIGNNEFYFDSKWCGAIMKFVF